ncbi:PAS domain S-box protein [Fimbriiglobus ruber]|uniref:histidine kinase n=1 Tax=Fimbriiglobus ruber TaxID=1908690 RepID=A0A225E7Y7_9BACT|nr:PAS domain S-box protein [Fimbriiglobus ruber]OWK44537.1 sensory box histidine kinase/response regulator [Fimbriiglobus ruber]
MMTAVKGDYVTITGPPPRILLVGTEQTAAAGVRARLEGAGYRVTGVAAPGALAVELVTDNRPDLVVIDVRPGRETDGVEAARVIRERLAIPVVYLTAPETLEAILGIEAVEPHQFLLKPVSDRELRLVVDATLFRHRVQEQHLRQKRLLAAVLEGTGDAVVATDREGRVTFLNSAAEALTRWTADDARGRAVADVVVVANEWDDRPVTSPLDRAMAEKHVVPLGEPAVLIARDQSPVPIDVLASPILDSDGDVLGGVLVLRDATSKRATAKALSNFAAIVASTQDAIIGHTMDGVVTSWNPAAERLYGYTAAEMIGRPIFVLATPEDEGEMRAMFARLSRGEVVPPYEKSRRRKDGSLVEVSVSISVVRDQDGRVTGFAAIVRDITQFRQLEEQYRHAQKMEAVGRLAGGIAHDFNNLLTVIGGYSNLLLEDLPHDNQYRPAIEEIREAGERATNLTRQLLAFSRKQVLQPAVLDLNDVVTQTGRMLQRLIGEDISISLILDPAAGCVKADPGQLEQVLMNLAVNARDAMPQGGRLTIETVAVETGRHGSSSPPGAPRGRCVRLAVTDNGSGMTDEVKNRIFEPFFTTKGIGKGTGLGLAMVFGFVTQSGGHICTSSTIGSGTTFTILLPVVDEMSSPPRPGDAHLTPRAQTGETILLVEDDGHVRSLVRDVLQMQGYVVIEAADGAEAVRAAEAHSGPIRLLVADVVMPEMRGQQLADVLRNRYPGLKVLYVSGYLDDGGHGSVVSGTENFLQKPFTPLGIAQKVRSVLDCPP